MTHDSSGAPRTAGRRRAPRLIGPAVAELVATLRRDPATFEIRLSAKTAEAIARLDARASGAPAAHDAHAAWSAVGRAATVEHATALRWRERAWQAVGEGRRAPADAQALSDRLEPRGAA